MEVQQRLYDIDDLWQIVYDEDNHGKRFELIEGELIEMVPPGLLHGRLATRLARFLDEFADENDLGIVTTETGYRPPESRTTVLGPDVAFILAARVAQPTSQTWVPVMPDLAVEIISPSNTMTQIRIKARIYLRNGTQLVWIVIPNSKSVEVCQLGENQEIQTDVIAEDGKLSGGNILLGFELPLAKLFTW